MRFLVVGGGSWGTAFTRVLLDRHHDVVLACRTREQAEAIASTGWNPRYLQSVDLSAAEAVALADEAKAIYVEESVNRYVVALLRQTRSDGRLYLGASPRSGIALLRVAKALALADQREFLRPDDVKAVAPAVLAHRLILAPEARSAGLSGVDVVREALERTPVPV